MQGVPYIAHHIISQPTTTGASYNCGGVDNPRKKFKKRSRRGVVARMKGHTSPGLGEPAAMPHPPTPEAQATELVTLLWDKYAPAPFKESADPETADIHWRTGGCAILSRRHV